MVIVILIFYYFNLLSIILISLMVIVILIYYFNLSIIFYLLSISMREIYFLLGSWRIGRSVHQGGGRAGGEGSGLQGRSGVRHVQSRRAAQEDCEQR